MPRVARALLTSVSILALAVPVVRAQQESQGQRQAQPQDPTVAQKLDKAQKKKIKKSLKELDTPYKQWLNEDVTFTSFRPKSATLSGNWPPTKSGNSSSSSSGCGAAAIRICRITNSRKSTTAESPMPTSITRRAYRDGKRIAVTCTSCGGRRTRLKAIRRVERMTGRWKKAVVRHPRILGKPGGGDTSRAWAKT